MAEAAKKLESLRQLSQQMSVKMGKCLLGEIPKGAINPIIMVNYEDNRNTDYTLKMATCSSCDSQATRNLWL